jgi:uncharacterized membrane protein YeaQ/YmgE (transglycosylase-associated protein family)
MNLKGLVMNLMMLGMVEAMVGKLLTGFWKV